MEVRVTAAASVKMAAKALYRFSVIAVSKISFSRLNFGFETPEHLVRFRIKTIVLALV